MQFVLDPVNIAVLVVLVLNFFLGIFVFLVKRESRVNQYFFLFSIAATLWGLSMLFFRSMEGLNAATAFARILYASAATIPYAFLFFIRVFPEDKFNLPPKSELYLLFPFLAVLALALTARPEVAFLDEPTSGVDVNGRDMIRAVIKNLASTGCAVVLATHELDEAERCADDVVIFHQAKIVANGSLESIRSKSYEIRFRSGIAFDVAALAKYLDFPIQNLGEEYVIMGTADAAVIGKFSEWMSFHGADIRDLRAGAQRLEDIFRRLTTGGGR